MKRYLLVLCAAALACATSATTVFAQASVLGSSFAIYGAASRGSATAYDTKNHVYLVVSAYGAVNGRFMSADGVPLPNCVSAGTSFVLGGASFGHFPRVAYSPDANGGLGGFMVTWHEGDAPGGGNTVHARAVSLAACLGADRVISGADKTWWEGGPAIAYSTTSQRFLVAWRAIASWNGSPNDISGQLLDLSGQPLVASPFKITDTAIYEDNPSVAYNPSTDTFLVAFAGYDSSAFVAARLVSAGGALGAQYELGRAGGTYITDTTFISATGRFLTAWHQLPGGATGRLVDGSTGIPEGAPIPLSTRFTSNDALSVAYNAVSGSSFLVSHDQLTSEDGGFEISAAGVPSAGFGATSIGGSGNFYPRVAASSIDKKWLLVTSNVFQTIYGQFISTATAAGGTPPPAPPRLAAPVQITALTPNVLLPTTEGTAITWTATASGGTGPLQYEFMRYTEGVGWSVAQGYGASNSYTWFPSAGTHAIQVWVRSSGSSASYDAYLGTGTFVVTAPAPKLMSLTSNVAPPVALNVPVTFTANATGGTSLQYKFLTYSSGTGWTVGQDYSATKSFVWYPPQGSNAVQVWMRAAGSSAAYQDWLSTGMFNVAVTPVKLTGVVSNVPFPALPSTTETWTAFASGGAGPLEYKFLHYDLGANAWTVLRDWAANNQASWTPGAANSGWHALQVWVRTAGSNVAWEDWRATDYFLVTASGGLTLTPNRTLAGIKVGDLVTFTASVAGGTGWEYQFLTFDGGAWKLLQAYSTQNTFSWFPPAGTCAVQVWIRAAGSHAYWERYQSTGYFVVNP
jgi:hypothetical protein